MAIKVNGTTVIDDNRNLINIASGAGSSTTYGDVGTYVFGYLSSSSDLSTTGATHTETVSGSNLISAAAAATASSGAALSGTWRLMGSVYYAINDAYRTSLFVRIS